MPTIVGYHDITKGQDHWLLSPKRKELFARPCPSTSPRQPLLFALGRSLRSSGSFAALPRALPRPCPSDSPTASLVRAGALTPFVWLVRALPRALRGLAPRLPPQPLSFALGRSLRSSGSFAALPRALRGLAPRTSPDSLTRSRWGAHSVRLARSLRSLALARLRSAASRGARSFRPVRGQPKASRTGAGLAQRDLRGACLACGRSGTSWDIQNWEVSQVQSGLCCGLEGA